MRRKTKIPQNWSKLKDLNRLDEKLSEIDEVPPDVLRKKPRAVRQADKPDWSKPRKGRSR